MNLLLDMNLSSQIVDMLADAGHHAAYWSMIGKRNAEDGEIAIPRALNSITIAPITRLITLIRRSIRAQEEEHSVLLRAHGYYR